MEPVARTLNRRLRFLGQIRRAIGGRFCDSSRAVILVFPFLFTAGSVGAVAQNVDLPLRQTVSLNGDWEVAEGQLETIPASYAHRIQVPGLLDMAEPPFAEVGTKNGHREAFWYRRVFAIDGPVPEIARLKVFKAKYGIQVRLNGRIVGESIACFTPAYFDVADSLKGEGQPNELLIRVGADREAIPPEAPSGWDFEKYRYIPGIYDSVELILADGPYIANVQVVPDLLAERVRILADIESGPKNSQSSLTAEVTEWKTGRPVGSGSTEAVELAAGERCSIDLTVPIADCQLWSPDDPFLYQLVLRSSGDSVSLRFGMRSFGFDPETGRALLNGKPIFLRGSNFCVLRFFEDAARSDRPWNPDWVRRLHRTVKELHGNAVRYCIGFPPEFWYDIADEEGILIEDEFPIWIMGKAPENPLAENIIPQYQSWMRERWNHPSVVIWDAQNESVTIETGKAIQAVRYLDYSNRPWENGWSAPQSSADVVEAHPYLFIRGWQQKPFRLHEMVNVSGKPYLNDEQRKPHAAVLINEYGWLWLNRDGSPTSLTKRVYESLLGPESTVEERRELHARYLAALTEFWRAHRECAGVLDFCGLGYSRPSDKPRPEGGATSDHFIDLENLTLEPHIKDRLRDAFDPVGVMLDFWEEEVPCGTKRTVPVYIVNDLADEWSGRVIFRLEKGGQPVSSETQEVTVQALGRETIEFSFHSPNEPENYTLVAERVNESGGSVRSIRPFTAVAAAEDS